MQQNDPTMIYTLSTYQTPSFLNRCLSLSNTKTESSSQLPQDRHWQQLSSKANPKLAQKYENYSTHNAGKTLL